MVTERESAGYKVDVCEDSGRVMLPLKLGNVGDQFVGRNVAVVLD